MNKSDVDMVNADAGGSGAQPSAAQTPYLGKDSPSSTPGRVASDDESVSMELIRLPVGEQADVDTDCIRIEELEDGGYRLTGTALCIAQDEGASVSLMNGLAFRSAAEAEAAGLAWADSVGVRRLYVSTGTRERPLRLTEIDLPA